MRKENMPSIDLYEFLIDDSKRGVASLIDIIKDKKDKLNLTNLQLADFLSIDKSTLDRLLSRIESGETKSIDFIQILKLSEFFGLDISSISKHYVASLKPFDIGELDKARIAKYVIDRFDIDGLKSIGFINDKNDIRAIEKRIVTFFGLNSIFEFESVDHLSLFSRTKNKSDNKMREFWLNSAIYQFERISNPNDFDSETLKLLVTKIKPHTRDEKSGFLRVIKALYNIGVTVIVQPYLIRTQVRGATMLVNDKPCIIITDFNNSYPTIWFALMHELYHVLFDFDLLESWKYHMTDNTSSNLTLANEEYANTFARELLFPLKNIDFVSSFINSHALIVEYADKHLIHPSIIYSFYCYEKNRNGTNLYSKYSKYILSSKDILKIVKTNPFDKVKLEDGIQRIKQILEPIIN